MDDEIIIEVDRKNISNKKNKNQKKNTSKGNNSKKKKKSTVNSNLKDNKRKKILKKLAIFVISIILLIIILSSKIFAINKFEVEGNERLSRDTIISLSGLELYQNIFNFNKLETINKIKENAYIEDVSIHRKLPGTIKFEIKERVEKYMLQVADSYIYINNQGYILEITSEKLNIPIITGVSTDLATIKCGDRLCLEDLKKLEKVIKIYETAKSNDLGELITKIDIADEKNFKIVIESEGKTVYLGDCSNLNTRLLYLKSILEQTVGKKGEIFLNIDLNSDNVYFRPSSN